MSALNRHKTLSDIERDVRSYYGESPSGRFAGPTASAADVAVSILGRAAALLEEAGDDEQRAFAREIRARIPAMLRGERSLT